MATKTEITLSPDVIDALRGATVAGMHLKLGSQLDRKLYQKVAKVIEALGGKWNRKAQAHVFDYDASDAVEDAIAAGAVVDMRKLYQHYPTPSDIAAQLVELVDIKPGMRVLEPSAGQGAIVHAIVDAATSTLGSFRLPEVCELQEKNRLHLFDQFGLDLRIVAADFLQLRLAAFAPDDPLAVDPYDRIVANPPFAQRQDITHVAHMYSLLAPGGKLVSVLSPRWTFAQDKLSRGFRESVKRLGGVWKLLPEGSFKPSGTSVRAGILQLTRAAAGFSLNT